VRLQCVAFPSSARSTATPTAQTQSKRVDSAAAAQRQTKRDDELSLSHPVPALSWVRPGPCVATVDGKGVGDVVCCTGVSGFHTWGSSIGIRSRQPAAVESWVGPTRPSLQVERYPWWSSKVVGTVGVVEIAWCATYLLDPARKDDQMSPHSHDASGEDSHG